MKTALKTVKALGSARNGVEHWWIQRLTAIALIPLFIWFTIILLAFGNNPEVGIDAYIFLKTGVVLFATLMLTALLHGNLGFKTIVEDYVHCESAKFFLLIASNLLVYLTAIFLFFTFLDIFVTNI
jgi:succinate dehydrogenase / fumarate reductase, membrane anchor subunit